MEPRERLFAWAKAAGATDDKAATAINGLLAEEREACARVVEGHAIEFVARALDQLERPMAFMTALIAAEGAGRIRDRGPTRPPLIQRAALPPLKRNIRQGCDEPTTAFLMHRLVLLEARVSALDGGAPKPPGAAPVDS